VKGYANSGGVETMLTTPQNHYYDLKYAMQFLLAKFMAKKNPKAAMKALDGHINEADA
jgi:hypothetical protein